MTYSPPGGAPDPYQPQQPYGQSYDPTTPYSASDPYAAPSSGVPVTGQPGYAPPYKAPGAQPYGEPGHGPAAYGQPGYGPQYVPVAPTNTMAILALVFAFIFAPASIVLGHVARKQIRQTGESGEGLATAGLWIGYIFTGLYVALCGLWLVLMAAGLWGASTAGSTTY